MPDDWRFRLADLALFRVFNKDFKHGGRFYGSIHMELPREFRPSIEIDGEKTVELDFSGLHIRMLYHRKGIAYAGDPYDLGGYPREIFKEPSLMMVNAKSEMAAKRSIYQHLRTKTNSHGRSFLMKDCDGIVWRFTQTLMDAFKEKHAQIAGDFFAGVGLELQFLDSEIMEAILKRLLKLGLVALPMHDSIVCKSGRRWTVEYIMRQEYVKVFGHPPVIHSK